MIFSFITRWFVGRRLRKQPREGFCPIEQVGRVVLLAQSKDVQSLLPGIQELVQQGVKITLVVECKRKEPAPVAIPGCYPILPLQTYWLLDCPTYGFVQSFNNNDGDVLIDMSTTASLPLQFLTVHSKAQFKLGIPKQPENPFHLQILVPEAPTPDETDEAAEPVSQPSAGELLQSALYYWRKIEAQED